MPNITINGTINLRPDMEWEDEFKWSPVTNKETVGLTGSTILQYGKRLSGRRMTLKSSTDTGWVTRAQLAALKTLDETVTAFNIVMGNGDTYHVMFDNTAGSAISATAKQPGKVPAADDYFEATLKFMEVPV